MTKKEFLMRAFLLNKKIKSKEIQIDELRSHAEYLTPQISDTPTGGSPVAKSQLEETVVRLLNLQEKLSNDINELCKAREEISQAIAAVENPMFETILMLRYLEYLSWEEVAARMNSSLQAVYKAHGRALQLVKVP